MQPPVPFIFVYGSLLSGFRSPAYEYIYKYFHLRGEGQVTGTIYDMGSFPVGVPADTGHRIKGELYEIRNPRELSYALAQLDDYEGLYPDEEEEVLYTRELTDVTLADGSTIQSWIYWYAKGVTDQPILDTDNLLDYKNREQ
ncbi:gamma-glutamylcyclotransferase [Niabella terrae]